MKIMVVGGGGREHAIVKKIKENKSVEEIFALPGNGGMAADATCVIKRMPLTDNFFAMCTSKQSGRKSVL